MKRLNLYIYKILPFSCVILFLLCGYILSNIDLYDITFTFFLFINILKAFLIKIYIKFIAAIFYTINSIIFFLLDVSYFIYLFIYSSKCSIIYSIKFLIGYFLNAIIFFADLITHNYAFLWGDPMFKGFYDNPNYGKIIMWFCDLITSLIVYSLYSLYIIAAIWYLLYVSITGNILLFYFFLMIPPIVYLIKFILIVLSYIFYVGFYYWYLMYFNEPKLFMFLLFFIVPGLWRYFYHLYNEFRIHFLADWERYEWADPDDEFHREDVREDTRYLRRAIILFFICFKFSIYWLKLILILGLKLILFGLLLLIFKIMFIIPIIYSYYYIFYLVKEPIIYYSYKLLLNIKAYGAIFMNFYEDWYFFNKSQIKALIIYPINKYLNKN